jgi:hypothetical protein
VIGEQSIQAFMRRMSVIAQYQNRKIVLAQALVEEDKGGFKNLLRIGHSWKPSAP